MKKVTISFTKPVNMGELAQFGQTVSITNYSSRIEIDKVYTHDLDDILKRVDKEYLDSLHITESEDGY